MDAQEKYSIIPDPTSSDFETLLKIAVDNSLCKLIEKLKVSLINTGIDRITNTNILRTIFTRCAFGEILDGLDATTLIKISESYADAIKNCPDGIFTKNVSSLIEHSISTSNSSFCYNIVNRLKNISCDDCIKILMKFGTDNFLAQNSVRKCNFTNDNEVLKVQALCKRTQSDKALICLFGRLDIWKPYMICEEFKKVDAANYYHLLLPLLFHNASSFTNDQWKAFSPLIGSDTFGPFDNFTPDMFQKIAEKNENLLVEILNRLNRIKQSYDFQSILKRLSPKGNIHTSLQRVLNES